MTQISDPLGSEDSVPMASVTVQGVEYMLLEIFTDKLGLHLFGISYSLKMQIPSFDTFFRASFDI